MYVCTPCYWSCVTVTPCCTAPCQLIHPLLIWHDYLLVVRNSDGLLCKPQIVERGCFRDWQRPSGSKHPTAIYPLATWLLNNVPIQFNAVAWASTTPQIVFCGDWVRAKWLQCTILECNTNCPTGSVLCCCGFVQSANTIINRQVSTTPWAGR